MCLTKWNYFSNTSLVGINNIFLVVSANKLRIKNVIDKNGYGFSYVK